MHELSITEGILKIALEEAKKNNVKQINVIKIKMGELSDLLPECINEYFKIVSKNSIAENAVLDIEKLPLKIMCNDCQKVSEINIKSYRCPICSSQKLKIVQGKEFYIDSLEVD